MAEVRKKVLEDKYNTAGIKKEKTKKENKKSNVKPIKKEVKKEEKKGLWTKFRIFCHGVASEFNFGLFFYAIDVIFALIQSLF